MVSVNIRRATEADLAALIAFTLAEAGEAEGRKLSPARVAAGVAAGLADPNIARYWVAETADRELAGSGSAVREWSDWHATHYWWIQSLYVAPPYRGRQVAERLVEAIAAAARADGAPELRLYVHDDNARAISAYRRAGFVAVPYAIMARRLAGEPL